MILTDINQTWKAPEGYTATGVFAEGAFLRVVYKRERESANVESPATLVECVEIYLNDQGREVLRKEAWRSLPLQPVYGIGVAKLSSRWERIKNWFRIEWN